MPGSSPSRRASLRAFIRGLAGAGLGGAALGAVGARQTARAAAERAPIVGVWLVTVPPEFAIPLAFFYVFHEDGILTHGGAPARRTDRAHDAEHELEYSSGAHGEWRRVGFNEYTFFETEIDYDQAGTPLWMDDVNGTITYDPARDRWTGTLTLQETELDGTPTGPTFTVAVTGRRVAARRPGP